MTAPITPGTAGAHRRRRLQLLAAGGIVAALLAIGMAFTGVFASPGELNCSNASSTAAKELVNIQELTPKATPGPTGKPWRDKLQKANDKYTEAQALATKCVTGDAPKTPNPRPCNGVVYMAYKAPPESKQFGPWPPGLQINGPGDAQKVGQVYAKAFDSDTMQLAAVLQPTYMGGEAYGADGVQAKAEFFKANSKERKHARDIVKGKLSRASFELKQENVRYKTQEAILGPDPCVSPVVRDTTSGGLKWKLTVHLAPGDGGGTYTVNVDCFWQLHQTIVVAAPKPKPTPRPKPAPTPQTPSAPKPKPKPPVTPPKPPVTPPKTPYEEDPPPPSF